MVSVESYGMLIVGVAAAAGILSLGLVVSPQRRVIATAGAVVLVLRAIVALGGVAGTYYHIVGVAPEYGPVDPRPRPIAALLASAYRITRFRPVLGKRPAIRRARDQEEERSDVESDCHEAVLRGRSWRSPWGWS